MSSSHKKKCQKCISVKTKRAEVRDEKKIWRPETRGKDASVLRRAAESFRNSSCKESEGRMKMER